MCCQHTRWSTPLGTETGQIDWQRLYHHSSPGGLRRDREEKEREIREGEEREMLKNMSAEERAAWERDHPKVLHLLCYFTPSLSFWQCQLNTL